jgi:hypothetical protein
MGRPRISLREVRALQPNQIIWDSAVAGYGARRQTSDVISYFLKYRTLDGRQRWLTIGRHGSPWAPDTARDRAKELLGEVVGGADPGAAKMAVRQTPTVAQLCELYFKENRRPSRAGANVARSYFLTLSNSTRSIGVEDRKTMTAIRNRPQTAVERC